MTKRSLVHAQRLQIGGVLLPRYLSHAPDLLQLVKECLVPESSSRPSSASKRPSSAEKRTSRPASAQSQNLISLPEEQQVNKFDDVAVVAANPIETDEKVESERLHNAEAVLERPSSSSKERKKKKSSRSSRTSTSSLERAVSPTERKKASKQETGSFYLLNSKLHLQSVP